jgi:membrane-bound inhibitor of C-type lysozyme
MKKYLSALAALTIGIALAVPSLAQAATTEKTAATKAPVKKRPAVKKTAPKKPVVSKEDEDDPEPDVAGSVAVDYACELGNKLTIHANLADRDHIALLWKNRLIRLERVSTSTGANRFESAKRGLVWIGIPAKGILLDSRKGQQLANECKSAEQLAMKTTPETAAQNTAASTPGPVAKK